MQRNLGGPPPRLPTARLAFSALHSEGSQTAARLPVESFTFSTHGLAPDASLLAYRELHAPDGHIAAPTGALSADVAAHRLDRIILFDRQLKNVAHIRQPHGVAGVGASHFLAHMVVSGILLGGDASGFQHAGPGDIVLQDLRKGSRTSVPEGHLITVSAGRALIEAAAGTANGMHGKVFGPDRAGLLGDYLQSLSHRAGSLEPDALPTVSRTFIDLLSLAVGPTGGGSMATQRRTEFDRHEAIQRTIERNLEDPALGAASIVETTGISRATLFRLLQPHGGVDRYVTIRRLEAIRATLDRQEDVTPLSSLAERYAFRDERDMRNRFRARFGLTPAAYRQMVDDPVRKLENLKIRCRSWTSELR